ncbi:MAG: Ig-like domain-containing protein, partial [bacterium]|nr:Ig-like domain-containing protein [bacterium]
VSGTTWSYTATVANGTTYQFNVKETDVAGNTSSATGDFTVIGDTTVPTVTLTEDQADMIVRDADTVVVTATFNEAMTSAPTVSIGSLVTNAPMTNTSGNIWTYSWNVPASNDGSAVVTVAGTDLAGNAYAGTNSLTFTIDNTAPVVAITAPAADARVNAAQVITFTDGEFTAPQCSIDNSVWVTCTSGVTTLNSVTGFSSLANGSFTLYLRDTDTAGNVGTTQVALVKDTAAPSVTSKTPGANAVGIDPAGNITVVFSENVVIDASNVSGVTAGVTGSGTDTATINPTSNLANNTTYTITLTGVTDMAGNTLPTTSWSFTTSGSYSIPLSSGWNLVSFPVVPTNTAASSVLGSLNDSTKIDSIWKYDPDNRAWGVYHPGDTNNTSDFSTLTAGEGYWVSYLSGTPGSIAGNGNLFQEGNSTPPQKSLAAGWNLIGYYQLENTTTAKADNALSTVSGQWTQLRTYNNTTKQFQSVIGTNPMGPGAGYWIFMKSSSFAPYLYGPGTADSN